MGQLQTCQHIWAVILTTYWRSALALQLRLLRFLQTQAQSGAMDVGQIIGKIRDIPRAAAITEGQKRKPGAQPPGSARVDQQDFDFIQVHVACCSGLAIACLVLSCLDLEWLLQKKLQQVSPGDMPCVASRCAGVPA